MLYIPWMVILSDHRIIKTCLKTSIFELPRVKNCRLCTNPLAMRQRILGSHTPPCHRRMVITTQFSVLPCCTAAQTSSVPLQVAFDGALALAISTSRSTRTHNPPTVPVSLSPSLCGSLSLSGLSLCGLLSISLCLAHSLSLSLCVCVSHSLCLSVSRPLHPPKGFSFPSHPPQGVFLPFHPPKPLGDPAPDPIPK